jgi:Kef-type K+ transport system membrane component KefB
MWVVLHQGSALDKNHIEDHLTETFDNLHQTDTHSDADLWDHISNSINESFHHPLSILLLQILVIILASRLTGYLFRKIQQPTVIGEVIAGILLGPSFLGYFFPETFSFIFPLQSLDNLQFFSQIGLILFMFIIGMELDLKLLRKTAQTALLVSHASIFFPYLLGVLLSLYLFQDYAPANIGFLPFALFMGISMSITAFPILARILQERGLTKTPLGTISLTSGAIDDVSAWALLAIVIAIVKSGTALGAISTVGLTIIYLLMMFFLVQPIFKKIGKIYVTRETISKSLIALIFVMLLMSSYFTETIGIHALFGAFVAGVIMPHNLDFKKNLVEKIEDLSLVLLLPLFFAFTGLRTQIGLLNEGHLWQVFGWVLLVAILGKFGGSVFAARFGGLSWNTSLSLGALMNTRGLIQLIVLNIGFELGILTPQIFAIMVLMALITTFMTTPTLQLIDYFSRRKDKAIVDRIQHPYRVLISFGPPAMGSKLFDLARLISPPDTAIDHSQYSAIHLTPSAEIHPAQALIFEEEGFAPIRRSAELNGLNINTIYKATADVQNEIIRTANQGDFDLLLMGSAKTVFSENYLGGKIRKILMDCKCNIGIFVDRNQSLKSKVLMLLPVSADAFALRIINNLLSSEQIRLLTIINARDNGLPPELPVELSGVQENKLGLKPFSELNSELSTESAYDLLIVRVEDWKTLFSSKVKQLTNLPSVLILKTQQK